MKEYEVRWCSDDCKETRVHNLGYWYSVHGGEQYAITGHFRDGPAFCWKCGTMVGVDGKGPWREKTVPESKLHNLSGAYHAHILVMCDSDEDVSDAESTWIEHLSEVGVDADVITENTMNRK